MPTTPSDRAGLKNYIDELKAQGKTESTSKSLAKAVIRLKEFSPDKFDLEAGGGREAILQRGVEDPTAGIPGAVSEGGGAGAGAGAGLGIPGGVSGDINLSQIYEDAMSTPEIKGLQEELTAKKSALTEALTNINDNPWYSEATRTGRIAKLNEQAQREIGDIEDSLNLQRADAQTKVNIAMQQYDIDDKNYQRNLQKLNLLISSGALLNATSQDIGQIALATGMSTAMVKGIQEQMSIVETDPHVITSTDNAGNVTVAIIDKNTGNVMNTQSLGGVGKASTTGTVTDVAQEKSFYASIEDGITQLKSGEAWGTVWNRIYSRFSPAMDDEEELGQLRKLIDDSLGVSWREGGAYREYRQTQSGEEVDPNIEV